MNARDWAHRRTLRARLTTLLIVLLLVACAAVGVSTTLAVRSFLLNRLDQQLQAAGARYAVALEHNDHDDDNNPETATVGQSVGTLGARLLNGRLTAIGVVSDPGHDTNITASDRDTIAALQPSSHVRVVNLAHLGQYRVLVTAGRDGDVLVTGLPVRGVNTTVHRVILAEIAVFLAVVLVIGLIGAAAVRQSLRPLARVAATARLVSVLPLVTGDGVLPERVAAGDGQTEVGQVASAMNHMLDRVQTALIERQQIEDRLRRFVADASHELRTPLAVIRSHTELIEQEAGALSPATQDSVQRIASETMRMAHLVDDLLLLARLDSGRPLLRQEVDLTRLAIDTVTDARIAGADHRWQLDLPDEPIVLIGDEQRLRQVLVNLLANARAHTPAGTVVAVSVRGGVDDSSAGIELQVSDDGPGIADGLLPHVRERFVHGRGERGDGSSGLGLAIVDGIVRAHGGTVDIESRPGRTIVTVRLPATGNAVVGVERESAIGADAPVRP